MDAPTGLEDASPVNVPAEDLAGFAQRMDGFASLVKGLGVVGRDPVASERPTMPNLSDDDYVTAFRGNGVARRVCMLLVQEALRGGWTVRVDEMGAGEGELELDELLAPTPASARKSIPPRAVGKEKPTAKGAKAGGGSDVDPAEANAIADGMREYFRKRGISPKLVQGFGLGRTFGGALLIGGFDDTGSDLEKLKEPRKPGSSLRWSIVIDRRAAVPGLLEDNPAEEGFGLPRSYTVTILNGTRTVEVHQSRCLRFPGEWAPAHIGGESRQSGVDPTQQGWDDSALLSRWDALRHFTSVHENTARVARDFSRAVYKLKNLHNLIAANREDLVRKRFELIEMCQSVLNAVLLDADAESFELMQRPIAGLPDLMDRYGVLLAAVDGTPITKLLGLSPSGFSSGEEDAARYENDVGSYRDDLVQPVLERACMWAFEDPKGPTKGKVPGHWAVTFPPVRAPTEKEKAEIRDLVAKAWATLVTAKVLLPEEAAEGMFGSGKGFGLDITLDRELREEAKELEAEALEAETEAMLIAARQPPAVAGGARPPVGGAPKPGNTPAAAKATAQAAAKKASAKKPPR